MASPYHGYNQAQGYGPPPGNPYAQNVAPGFAPVQRGPPPGADPVLWQYFSSVDLDNSNHISTPELQQALINGDWSPFDLDTVKLLITMFDSDRSGTIGFNEFAGLWKYIQDWQNVFRHFDRDRSGSIEGHELTNALRQFGYNLSPQIVELIERKYDFKQGSGPAPAHHGYGQPPAAPTGITFDRFVRACVVVKQLTESFQKNDLHRTGFVQLSYDQFMSLILSLP